VVLPQPPPLCWATSIPKVVGLSAWIGQAAELDNHIQL